MLIIDKRILFCVFQKCIASNETSGIDIVVQIILLMELTALEDHQDEAMKLKSSAIKTLLAVMESHQDSDIVDRILVKIGSPDQLVCVNCCTVVTGGHVTLLCVHNDVVNQLHGQSHVT